MMRVLARGISRRRLLKVGLATAVQVPLGNRILWPEGVEAASICYYCCSTGWIYYCMDCSMQARYRKYNCPYWCVNCNTQNECWCDTNSEWCFTETEYWPVGSCVPC